MANDVRAAAAQALARVMRDGSAFSGAVDQLAKTQSDKQKNSQPKANSIDKRDAAFYRELCYGTLRHFHYLNPIALSFLKKPFAQKDTDIYALLLIGLYQIIFLRTPNHAALNSTVSAANKLKKGWAKGLLNAVLRNYIRQHGNQELNSGHPLLTEKAALASHPKWLHKKIIEHWPLQQQQIIAYNNSPPPMSLRVNLQKISRGDYQALLNELDIICEPDQNSHTGLTLNKAVDVAALPNFEQGWVSVQDIGAQHAAALLNLKADLRVLDACAAPGGKTTHILESAQNLALTALDSNPNRLEQVTENLARCNKQATLIHADAADIKSWWDGQPFDRILLDAPCSGSGIISHHPDIKLLRRANDIAQFSQQQSRLLNQLWATLKEGGELLYCTCSIMPQENQQVIQAFIAQTPSASLLAIDEKWGIDCSEGRQLLPNRGKNGGFFYARLSKNHHV